MSSMEMKPIHRHVIVYQFGKVASTSIVNSLNAAANVTSVQSHFLGTDNLKQMVDLFVDVERPRHFYEHNLGQFLKNLEITRSVYEFKMGLRPTERLAIVSLCRDALDWMRSSISQDIAGYLSFFDAVAKARCLQFADQNEMIKAMLPYILGELNDAVTRVGGIDEFLQHGKPWDKAFPLSNAEHDPLVRSFRRFFALMLRPFEWFKEHFEQTLDIKLSEFSTIAPHLFYHETKWCDIFVLRYEDISRSMPIIVDRMGIENTFRLSKDNISSSKDFADAIRQGFECEQAETLGAAFHATHYSRLFGYNAATDGTSL